MMDNKLIKLDTSDWNSIRDTINKINEAGQMQVGETEDGERIVIDVSNSGGEDCLVTDIYQRNGWIRQMIYHPTDYYIEELYHR